MTPAVTTAVLPSPAPAAPSAGRAAIGRERERARRTASAPVAVASGGPDGLSSHLGAPAALADAASTRRQAMTVLEALCAERERFEARITSARPDPVSTRAGRGAIDRAIRRTKSIVASLDRLLRSSGA